ncbi:MAG: hypothetical protein RR321_04190 [Acidaminococcaceae bacterium]
MNKKNYNWSELWQAWCVYVKQPKTVFDLQDRAKAVLFLVVVIVLAQAVVQALLNLL